MRTTTSQLCLLAHRLPGLGDSVLRRLLIHFGSIESLWDSDPSNWEAVGAPQQAIYAAKQTQNVGFKPTDWCTERDFEVIQQDQVQVISVCCSGYPPLLRLIYDPPPVLYIRGDAQVLQYPQLAIVGSRKASPAGLRAASQFARAACSYDYSIVSGLALGIDGAAHRGALDAGGKTVAVMATGIDRLYPRRHCRLAEQVMEAGCLVTEQPPGQKPLPGLFPRRNRIISGLSQAILVAEAALRSGSLITAGSAMEQGREVFAVPHSLFHPGGRGCLKLLVDGAGMALSIEDVLQAIGPLRQLERQLVIADQPPVVDQLSPGQNLVLAAVGFEPTSLDDLAKNSGLPVARVMAALSELELSGKIARQGGAYIRC